MVATSQFIQFLEKAVLFNILLQPFDVFLGRTAGHFRVESPCRASLDPKGSRTDDAFHLKINDEHPMVTNAVSRRHYTCVGHSDILRRPDTINRFTSSKKCRPDSFAGKFADHLAHVKSVDVGK